MPRRRTDDDFKREIESHIAHEADRLIADGVPPSEASAAARRTFGNTMQAEERFYESRRVLWLDRLVHDIRYAIRGLAQTPAFALVAVMTLAMGIASTTAVATTANAVFFRLPPIDDPGAVRTLAWSSPRRAFTNGLFRGPLFDARHIDSFPEETCRELQRRATSFSSLACWRLATEALTDEGLWRVHAVSGTYFEALGVAAAAGRTIGAADDAPGAPLVAMTRNQSLLGHTVRLYGHSFTVIGILPEGFSGLAPLAPADVMVPFAADRLFPVFQRNDWTESQIVGRIRRGIDVDTARAEAEVIVQQLIQAAPPREPYDPPRLYLEELSTRLSEVQRTVTRPLQLLGATVGLLLVITCANIGGLLFARGRARQKELATRLAVGGSRGRIVQQLLTESLVLCAAGALIGIVVASASSPLLPSVVNAMSNTTTLGVTLQPDSRVLLFAIALSMACGVSFGLLPALRITRVDPAQTLKQSSSVPPRTTLRAGKITLAVQIALSMVVITGAGLLVRTLINLRSVPLGYQPEGLVFVETNNPVGRPRTVVEETLAALRTLPGVSSAAVSQWPIFNNAQPRFPICVPTGDATPQQLDYSFVFPGFFDTWGVRFVAGRDIDDSVLPQVVVNESFARHFLARRNPLDATISFGPKGCPGPRQVPIVGVVADHIDRQRVEVIPSVYARYPRAGALYVTTYAIRAAGDETALMPAMRRVITEHGIAPNRDVQRGTDYRDGVMRQERVLASLLVAFASIALFISALGIYGMLNYTVNWRIAEIGLRMAIGAQPGNVTWMIMRESVAPLAAGVVIGLAAAAVLVRTIQSFLFNVPANDPLTLGLGTTILVVVAAIAAWLPACRAMRVDPVAALRCE
jgi:predicted permease